MNHLIPSSPEFGQPDHLYAGPASLIVAVTAFPARFSSDTHSLVISLIADAIQISPIVNVSSENPSQELTIKPSKRD